MHDFDSCDVERRSDGAVVVRVHSRLVNGLRLPDAVFAFRAGDPQYAHWNAQLLRQEMLASAPPAMPPIVPMQPS